MKQPPTTTDPLRDASRRQFGVRRLLVMILACGVVLALARATRAPLLFQAAIAIYLGSLAIYAVVRIPWVYLVLRRQTSGWRRLKQHRQELEAEMAEAARHRPPAGERR
ncbi:MAG: hypothetical protein HY000_04790 [Planctomycetes bacterium]|nr:hypothetical protein [Planctomycetota bacterium]